MTHPTDTPVVTPDDLPVLLDELHGEHGGQYLAVLHDALGRLPGGTDAQAMLRAVAFELLLEHGRDVTSMADLLCSAAEQRERSEV